MTSKSLEINLQNDFKETNNKPGSRSTNFKHNKAIKEAKQVVRTKD